MRQVRYDQYMGERKILRDALAIDRTVLANERTLLAYMRTALALVVVGASALRFIDSLLYEVVGAGFLLAGVVTGVLGVARFRSVQSRIGVAILSDHQSAQRAEAQENAAEGMSSGGV